MKITATIFDSNYHYSEYHGNMNCEEYIRHNIDVFNTITVEENGVQDTFQTVYQTGCHYIHGDYSLPSTELELSEDGGADTFLCEIDREFYESDFDHLNNKKITEFLEEKNHRIINTHEKLWLLYDFLRDNKPNMTSFEPEVIITAKKYFGE